MNRLTLALAGVLALAGALLLGSSPVSAQNCSGQPAANTVCAGPTSGGAGFPSFRALVPADISALSFPWANITGTPTTLAGYGITNARTAASATVSYYVNADSGATHPCGNAGAQTCAAGSDSNAGTSASAPFLTLQKAINVIAAGIDIAGQSAQIFLADGGSSSNHNYSASCVQGGWVGASVVNIIGNSSAPTNVKISPSGATAGIQVKDLCTIQLSYVDIIDNNTNNGVQGILVGANGNGGHVDIFNVTFSAMSIGTQMYAGNMGSISANGPVAIDGGAATGIFVDAGGFVDFGSQTVTVTGTPAYSSAFASFRNGGVVGATNTTFSGSATGARCLFTSQPAFVNGYDPNAVFPGNANCVVDVGIGAIGIQNGSTYSYGNAGDCLKSGGGANVLNTFGGCSGSGVPQNNLNTQTANYTILNTDCGKTIQAGTGSTGLFTVTLPAVAGFASNCVLAVYNGDTLRGKILSGFPVPVATSPNNILWAGDTIQVGIVNGAWAFLSENARHRIVASTTLFVDNTNGADTNDCLAATVGACKTIQKAFDYLNTWDGNAQSVTVSVADGAYTNALVVNGPFHGNPTVTLTGNTGTPANVTLTTTSTDAITVTNGATLALGGFKLSTVTGGNTISVSNASFLTINGAMNYGAAVNFHMLAAGGSVLTITADYTISGAAQFHWLARGGAQIVSSGTRVVTITGTPAFSSAFAAVSTNGVIVAPSSTTYSGSATGPSFSASQQGYINNTSATFPGSNTTSTIATHAYVSSPGTPTISSCGTSPGSASGTDFAGKVTEGTTATGCTITFATGSTMNACTVSLSTGAAVGVSTLGATLVVTHASLSSNVLYWQCSN